MMAESSGDAKLVACCGLYCGACRSYRRGRCPGCAGNEKATWCPVRTCCRRQEFASCAQCGTVDDVAQCSRFNTLIARVFGLIFNSNRCACIAQIKALGLEGHAQAMARAGRPSLPRR